MIKKQLNNERERRGRNGAYRRSACHCTNDEYLILNRQAERDGHSHVKERVTSEKKVKNKRRVSCTYDC